MSNQTQIAIAGQESTETNKLVQDNLGGLVVVDLKHNKEYRVSLEAFKQLDNCQNTDKLKQCKISGLVLADSKNYNEYRVPLEELKNFANDQETQETNELKQDKKHNPSQVFDDGRTLFITCLNANLNFDPTKVTTIIIVGNIFDIDTIIKDCVNVVHFECYNCNTLTCLPKSDNLVMLKLINCNMVTGLNFQYWNKLCRAIFKHCNTLFDHAFSKLGRKLIYLEIENCKRVSNCNIETNPFCNVVFSI
jgi:hypothetical protein